MAPVDPAAAAAAAARAAEIARQERIREIQRQARLEAQRIQREEAAKRAEEAKRAKEAKQLQRFSTSFEPATGKAPVELHGELADENATLSGNDLAAYRLAAKTISEVEPGLDPHKAIQDPKMAGWVADASNSLSLATPEERAHLEEQLTTDLTSRLQSAPEGEVILVVPTLFEEEAGPGDTGETDGTTPTGETPGADPVSTDPKTEEEKYDYYRALIEKNGKFDDASGARNVIGFRNTTSTKANGGAGAYDDVTVLVWKDATGKHVREYKSNTEPAEDYTGYATGGNLGRVPTGYYEYQKGHSDRLGDVLRSTSDFNVVRDTNHDGKFTESDSTTGGGSGFLFHAGGSSSVGSAGCQTMDPETYRRFWSDLGENPGTVGYTLVNVTPDTQPPPGVMITDVPRFDPKNPVNAEQIKHVMPDAKDPKAQVESISSAMQAAGVSSAQDAAAFLAAVAQGTKELSAPDTETFLTTAAQTWKDKKLGQAAAEDDFATIAKELKLDEGAKPQDSDLNFGPSTYDALITKYATENGVPPRLLKAQMEQESGFKPDAVSPVGAGGLIQLMPGTFEGLRKAHPELGSNRFDPETNIHAAALYMKEMLDGTGGNVQLALAAYNAGPNNDSVKAGKVPQNGETEVYVANIMKRYGGSEQVSGESNPYYQRALEAYGIAPETTSSPSASTDGNVSSGTSAPGGGFGPSGASPGAPTTAEPDSPVATQPSSPFWPDAAEENAVKEAVAPIAQEHGYQMEDFWKWLDKLLTNPAMAWKVESDPQFQKFARANGLKNWKPGDKLSAKDEAKLRQLKAEYLADKLANAADKKGGGADGLEEATAELLLEAKKAKKASQGTGTSDTTDSTEPTPDNGGDGTAEPLAGASDTTGTGDTSSQDAAIALTAGTVEPGARTADGRPVTFRPPRGTFSV